jgi:hypothetical protein
MPIKILPRTRPYAIPSALGPSLAVCSLLLGVSPNVTSAQDHSQDHQGRQVAQLASNPQPSAIAPAPDPDAGAATLVMYSVRTDLRRLVMAEEAYWRTRQTYASDVAALPDFHPAPGVIIQIVHAKADGWAARAYYGNGTSGGVRNCVVWVGEVDPADRPATNIEHKVYPEAETSCDGDGYNVKTEWGAAGRSYMTYALQKLILNENRYYAFHGQYTTVAAQLDPFIWDRDVAVDIVAGTATGWAARASFGPAPGKSCVIRHGSLDAKALPVTTADKLPVDAADQVTCDRM